jgi:hypothetical protein
MVSDVPARDQRVTKLEPRPSENRHEKLPADTLLLLKHPDRIAERFN